MNYSSTLRHYLTEKILTRAIWRNCLCSKTLLLAIFQSRAGNSISRFVSLSVCPSVGRCLRGARDLWRLALLIFRLGSLFPASPKCLIYYLCIVCTQVPQNFFFSYGFSYPKYKKNSQFQLFFSFFRHVKYIFDLEF